MRRRARSRWRRVEQTIALHQREDERRGQREQNAPIPFLEDAADRLYAGGNRLGSEPMPVAEQRDRLKNLEIVAHFGGFRGEGEGADEQLLLGVRVPRGLLRRDVPHDARELHAHQIEFVGDLVALPRRAQRDCRRVLVEFREAQQLVTRERHGR
ncbi:MAG: hypothetical protein JW751_24625 [Polyangiaceae bacterium]|nr:hypothetical protein [Polyangiaceae bacterium]